MRLIRRLAYLLRFTTQQSDLREEMELHRTLVADDLRRRGLSPAAADAAAQRAMGNDTFMREEARGVWITPAVEAAWKDWRYAWRGLVRSPLFATVAIVSLGLGIGANTAIFSIMHAVLLARLPVPAANELVQLRRSVGAKGVDEGFSTAEVDALAAGPMSLTTFTSSSVSTEIDGASGGASVEVVDANYFALVGITAQRGRVLVRDDAVAAAPVAVVTERFWRRRLNGDSNAVGRVIKIDQHPFTVIGIMPRDFAGLRFPATTEMIVPYNAAVALGIVRRDDPRRPQFVVGRLKSGMSLRQASDVLDVVWNRCCATGALAIATRGAAPDRSQLSVVDVSRGIPNVKLNLRGQYSRILIALMAGVAILLLVACANVANLLVARSATRTGELAVRLALGASRARLVAQLLIESIQLSVLGGLLGVLIARWGMTVLVRSGIGDLSGVVTSSVGSSVLAFTAIVSVLSGAAFGVVPALRVMRTDLITPLKQGGRRSVDGRRGLLDRGLVALQMSLALLLVSGATLLVQTLRNLEEADLQFDPENVLAVTVETRHTSYERQGMTVHIAEDILARVRATPGVKSAAFASVVPVYGGRSVTDNVTVRDGQPVADGRAQTWFAALTPDFFSAMGISILSGRDIGRPTGRTTLTATRDVVVNEKFVKRVFPDRNPLGQVFYDSDDGDSTATPNRVVGVVSSAKYAGVRVPPEPMYFVQLADGDWPFLVLVVRTTAGASSVRLAMTHAITAAAPGIGQGDPILLSSSVDDALVRERMSAALATLFGAIALGLAAVGLYGVMLYQVAERTTEIGIRVALGARPATVMWLVLRQSLIVAAIGLGAGIPLAILAGRAVQSQLYGVAPYDVAALVAAAALLVAVTIVASLIPARRAVRVDPISALRS